MKCQMFSLFNLFWTRYEKLQRWNEALNAYISKSSQASSPNQTLDATLGVYYLPVATIFLLFLPLGAILFCFLVFFLEYYFICSDICKLCFFVQFLIC
jgi:hypothetical protein